VKPGDVAVQFDGENVRSAAQLTRLVRETPAGRTVKLGLIRDGKRMDIDVTPAAPEHAIDLAIASEGMVDLEKQLKDVQEHVRQYRFERRTPGPGGTLIWEEEVPSPGQPMPPGGMMRWHQQGPMPIPEDHVMQYFNDAAGNFLFMAGRGRLGVNVQELTPELAAYFGVKEGLLVNSVRADTPAAKAGIKAGDVIGSINGKAVVTATELIKELADKEGEVTIGVTREKKALPLKATLEPRKAPARRSQIIGRPV
jgi:hypothetical protein